MEDQSKTTVVNAPRSVVNIYLGCDFANEQCDQDEFDDADFENDELDDADEANADDENESADEATPRIERESDADDETELEDESQDL